jgi:hypothetical protein
VDLLVRELEKLVNVSQEGQLEIEPVVRTFLKRIKRDPAGVPIKLYPFTRKAVSDSEPEPVEIDPRVSPSAAPCSQAVAFPRPCSPTGSRPAIPSLTWRKTMTPPRKSSRRPSAASSAGAKRLSDKPLLPG